MDSILGFAGAEDSWRRREGVRRVVRARRGRWRDEVRIARAQDLMAGVGRDMVR